MTFYKMTPLKERFASLATSAECADILQSHMCDNKENADAVRAIIDDMIERTQGTLSSMEKLRAQLVVTQPRPVKLTKGAVQ